MDKKIKSFLRLTIFILLASCAFDKQLFFGVEESELNITFGTKRYDFLKMSEESELEDISIGDSLKIETIIDSTALAFYKLEIDGETEIKQFTMGDPIDPGVDVPTTTKTDSSMIYDDESPQLKWAKVRAGSLKISLTNNFEELSFSAIRFELITNEDSFDEDLNVTQFSILNDSITSLQPGESKQYIKDLNGEWITDKMNLKVSYTNLPLDGSSNSVGIDDSQYIDLNYTLSDCRFDSTKAKFENETITHDTLFTFDMEDISPRSIKTKDAEIRVSIKNNTPMLISIDPSLDSLYDLNNDSLIYQTDPIMVGNDQMGYDKYNINNTVLMFNEDESTTRLSYVIEATSPNNNQYLRFSQADSTFLKMTITRSGSGYEVERDFRVKRIDGLFEGKEYDLNDERSEVDIDWDDFEGVSIDSILVKLKFDIERENMVIDEINMKTLMVQGIKDDGTLSELISIDIPPLTSFNDTTIIVTGVEPLINFKPDSIIYSLNPELTYDGMIYDNDFMRMDMEFGVPLQGTIQDTVRNEGDVESIDAFSEEGDDITYNLKDMIMDAHINYQLATADSQDVEFWAEIEVKLSEEITTTYDGEKDSLIGDIQTLFTAKVRDDDFNAHGFYISDPTVNPQYSGGNFYIDEDGIHIDGELANKLINKDTYIQPSFKIFPTEPGKYIKMDIEDYIDLTLKIKAELEITYER